MGEGGLWDRPTVGSPTKGKTLPALVCAIPHLEGGVDSVVNMAADTRFTEGIREDHGVVRTQETLSGHPPVGVGWVKAFWNGVPVLNLVKSTEG